MTCEQLEELVEAFARNFRTPPRLPIDQWCNENIPIQNDVSEMFNMDLTPWFRDPLRACADHSCSECYIVAAPGLGKTTVFMEAFPIWVACNNPQSILLVSDNIVLLEQFLDSRLQPLIARTPAMQSLLPRQSDRQKKLLMLSNSMFIMARAANRSSAQQVSSPIQILDESWLYEQGLISFFRKRGHDRERRKLICVSQAGFQKTEFHDDVIAGNQYEYFWACQKCGQRQPFRLPISFDSDIHANLKFEGGDKKEIDWKLVRESVHLECSACHCHHPDEIESRRTLSKGAVWIKTAEGEEPKRRVYTIPALARYQIPYYELAREFLKARRSWKMGAHEDFIQYVQARCSVFWAESDYQQPLKIVKSGYFCTSYAQGEKAPNEVVRVMSIDRQKDAFWVVIRAWCEGGNSRLLRFAHILSEQGLRDLQLQYQVEDRFVAQDSAWDSSGAYQLSAKYGWWCIQGTGIEKFQHPKLNSHGRVVGQEWRLYSKVQEIRVGSAKTRLIQLATEKLKDILATLRDSQPVEWLIPADIEPLYLRQLAGEMKKSTVEAKTKREVFRWTYIAENHAWDAEYVNLAFAVMSGVLKLTE